ncbi:MAG: uncharacterized protein JWP01_4238 [Myxococcales bacterium]|nr:uncharacterized protein [Myxococcales bacterium]
MYDEWETSAHARAASSTLYKAAVANAGDATCDRCHAPLEGIGPKDHLASEGVTCDVCHTLREPRPGPGGADFRLAVDDMVKFGPRCDLKDHYFHRMGCSPEHKEAAVCGSCHWWEPKGIPVFTEYKDWRDGPSAKANEPCQSCHMPDEKAMIATGSPVRTGVPHHGLIGLAGDLRKRALSLEVAVRDEGGALQVSVSVRNVNAGHSVPAGLPERRVVVKVRIKDASGTELATETRQLGRVLVDATGTEVPFWRATKVGSDTRIAPGATWTDAFVFGPPAGGTVEVDVVYRGVSDPVAKLLAVADVEEMLMSSARVPFGPPTAAGRAKVPKTIITKPPPAGKRPRSQGLP